MQSGTGLEPCKRHYHLTCKVVVKGVSYQNVTTKSHGDGEQVEEEMVFLIPQLGTARDMFFMAWMPPYSADKNDVKGQEIVMEVGHPVYHAFRGALCRPNRRSDEFHIFVMGVVAEECLKQMDGKEIQVTVLSEDEEERADEMPSLQEGALQPSW